ncbi:MAG TPA: D-aminoacyl-tRNA deacylase [Myxococcota bacterium]|nr:D-aminoacyl-tRNA deacylase [Myxococcota bacterium]
MRAVAQRVSEAQIRVGGEVVGEMGAGLLALVGVAAGDGEADARELAAKLVNLRVFPDAEGRMNRSLLESGGALGVVSQFTLLADTKKGRRPFYGAAAAPEVAEALIAALVDAARAAGVTVITGRFGATMRVALVNEGPVTLLLDTRPVPG